MVATIRRTAERPMITDAAGATQAREHLAALDRRLADLDARHEDVTAQLGEAFAAMELGDKKASARAGQLGMRRSGLDTERRDLRLTRDAVAAWDAEEDARIGQAARAEILRNYTMEAHGPRWRTWYAEAIGERNAA